MGLFDWLFRRERARREAETSGRRSGPSERAKRESSGADSTVCPHCGTVARQTQPDGRCLACGTLLPEALRAPTATSPRVTKLWAARH
jgi:hypothetical protein